jgi:hypothetical protein
MKALLKTPQPLDAAKIAHSVIAYDRATEELALELPIPLFLDTLAVKIARVPPEDKYGALSYLLDARAVDIFRFLLGLNVDMSNRDYFLEPTIGYATSFGASKLEAVELLTKVTPHPRYSRTEKPGISERELVVPTLRLLDDGPGGWMAESDIIARLTKLFSPSGQDTEILEGRGDTYFSQKVQRGLAHYEQHALRISNQGRSAVRALLS